MLNARSKEGFETVGYSKTARVPATIADGKTTHKRIDMSRVYTTFIIRCEDGSNLQAGTMLSIDCALESNTPLIPIAEVNSPITVWSELLPMNTAFQFTLQHVGLGRFLRFHLSNAASGGDVRFDIYGIDPSVSV